MSTNYFIHIPLIDFGMITTFGCSKEALSAAIADDLGATLIESGLIDFGIIFLTTGGGVERFLALGFSKLAARALKAGDLPLTRTRSGLNDILLER